MSYPTNISVDYPCQGDTWQKEGRDYLTVTAVTPTGVIYYMKGISCGNYSKTKATLSAFKNELERHELTIPHYCTDKYYHTYGSF